MTRLAACIKRTTKHCNTQNAKALGLVVLKMFYAYLVMPMGVACLDPRGTVGKIYKEDLLYTQNRKALGLMVSEKRFCSMFAHCLLC